MCGSTTYSVALLSSLLPPSGAHALLDVDSEPTLQDLDELVVGQVACMGNSLPLHLSVEQGVIAAATKSHPNNYEGAL